MPHPHDGLERQFKIEDWYDDPRYSDITIKYSGKEFKGHKVIFCARCKYFERALAGDRVFMESAAGVITLRGDDPAALEDMIRYIYTSELSVETSNPPSVSYLSHLVEIMFVSDKYGLPSLTSKALKLLQRATRPDIDDLSSFLKLLNRIVQYPAQQRSMDIVLCGLCSHKFRENFEVEQFRRWLNKHVGLRDRMYEGNIDWLVKHEVFRAQMKADAEFAIKWVDHLHEAHVRF